LFSRRLEKAAELLKTEKSGLGLGQGYYCRNSKGGEWNIPIDEQGHAETWIGKHGRVKLRELRCSPLSIIFAGANTIPIARIVGGPIPHRLPPLVLATEMPIPTRVVCHWTKNVHPDKNTDQATERDVSEHLDFSRVPSGLNVSCGRQHRKRQKPWLCIYGHKARSNRHLGRKRHAASGKGVSDDIDSREIPGLSPIKIFAVHEKNWFDSIRATKAPNANIDLAVRVQTVISLAEMSTPEGGLPVRRENPESNDKGGREVQPLTYGTLPLS